MKIKTVLFATLFMLGFGAYIGYANDKPPTIKEVVIPRFTDVPKPQGFNFDINLNKNTVTCNSTEQDVKVTIQKKDSIVYKHVTSIVEKPVYVERRMHIPVKRRASSCTDVLPELNTMLVPN